MPEIAGHSELRQRLAKLRSDGALPTALMLSGPPGVGKRLVARELAQSIFCEAPNPFPCGSCMACHRFAAGNTPDLFQIDCEDREQSGVAEVRELLYSLNLKPFAGSQRVIILDNAERLSIQSANTLLKSLEEPRPGTHFILVSSNPSKLPSTLLSRCQRWSFDLLSRQELREILSTPEWAETIQSIPLEEALTLADGSPGNLRLLVERYESWAELKSRLAETAGGSVSAALALADDLAKERDELAVSLHLLRVHARSQLFAATHPDDQHRWAVCLSNLVSSERLIFERNIAAAHVLRIVLTALAGINADARFTRLANSDTLLDKLVP